MLLRQCLLYADSEEEVAPSKKSNTTTTASKTSSVKSRAPGKSPAGSKTWKSKSSPMTSKAQKGTATTIADFFGAAPIKRSHQVKKVDASSQLSRIKDSGGSSEGRSSHTPSEVQVIPESPAPGEEEGAEFDDVAMAFLQEEEMAKQEVCCVSVFDSLPVCVSDCGVLGATGA